MTDRYNALTVVLGTDMREDDAEQLIHAIKMLRNVISVEPNITNVESHIASTRVRTEIAQRLMEVLYPVKDGSILP